MNTHDDGASVKYLLISDFDQTLSFNDSGLILSELLGIPNFRERVAALERTHLVQQGGELAYLLLHDPDFRGVRREHLAEVGKRVRLKANIALLPELLNSIGDHHFDFYVVSAAPEEVIQSALEDIIDANHIYGTQFRYDEDSGAVQAIARVPAGYGKVAVVDGLRADTGVAHDRVIYVGDGSSDVHVMLHTNRLAGLTIAVSENQYITQIACRTLLSDDALTVAIPILEDVLGWDTAKIRAFFSANGFVLREWDKMRTDAVTLARLAAASPVALGRVA